jgi:hypothetical protein
MLLIGDLSTGGSRPPGSRKFQIRMYVHGGYNYHIVSLVGSKFKFTTLMVIFLYAGLCDVTLYLRIF